MRILLVNQDWFKEELKVAGHEVLSCGADSHFDVRFAVSLIHWSELRELCKFEPDVVCCFDNSVPLFICGLEEVRAKLLFYSVDAHHHLSWQKFLPRTYDHVFVAQKDFMSQFLGSNVSWLPLWASKVSAPSEQKKHDAVFVGTLDKNLNPKRVQFLESLREHVPVECLRGEFWNIYPYAKVVLNQTVLGDLNFRVFEGMASGAALLTESIENGLFELFTDGVELVSYLRNDPVDASKKLRELLADDIRREEIGKAGRQAILQSHLAYHRCDSLLTQLKGIHSQSERSSFSLVPNFITLGLYLETIKRNPIPAFGEAVKLADKGAKRREALTQALAQFLLQALAHYDRVSKDTRATEVLRVLTKTYPQWFG